MTKILRSGKKVMGADGEVLIWTIKKESQLGEVK